MTGSLCLDHRGEANAKDKMRDRAELRARGAIFLGEKARGGCKKGHTGHLGPVKD